MNALHHLAEEMIAGTTRDRQVKGAVFLDEGAALLHHLLLQLDEPRHLAGVRRGRPVGGQPRHLWLDQAAQLELLEQAVASRVEHRGQHRHRRAARFSSERAITNPAIDQPHGL